MIGLRSWPPSRRRLVLAVLAGVSIGTYCLYFAGGGLRAGFTHDDLMNIYGSWRAPVSAHLRDIVWFFRFPSTYRPMGSLLYRVLFDHFGFTALPFRLACYALLLVNLWLAYALVRRLAGSREVATLTVLLHAYHGRFWPLYSNTGLCYDLLCFFFYSASFLYYLRSREREFPLRWARLAIWSGLYILCLNSKEMAVTLPVVIAVYELLAAPPRSWRPAHLGAWMLREGRAALVGGALTALFILGRIAAPHGLPSMEAYRPVLRLDVYLGHARHFLGLALYQQSGLRPAVAGAILLVLLLVAAVQSRSVPLRLAVAWMLIGILPVAFIHQRGLDAVYIPALAFALCLSLAVVAAAGHAPQFALRPAVVFVSVLLLLTVWHQRGGRIDFDLVTSPGRHIGRVYEQLRGWQQCQFPKESRILFLRDPFPDEDWASTFLVYLSSRDQSLQVRRMDRLMKEADTSQVLDFDMVFSYEQNRLAACEAGLFQRVLVRDLPDRARLADCRSDRPSARSRPRSS